MKMMMMKTSWRNLLRMKVPISIKLFGWRMIHDTLPTRVNLAKKRRVNLNLVCPRCGEENETLFHALWSCSRVQAFWHLSGMHSSIDPNGSIQDCKDWFDQVAKTLKWESLEMFLILCWWCWHYRNQVVFRKRNLTPQEELATAKIYFNTLRQANLRKLYHADQGSNGFVEVSKHHRAVFFHRATTGGRNS